VRVWGTRTTVRSDDDEDDNDDDKSSRRVNAVPPESPAGDHPASPSIDRFGAAPYLSASTCCGVTPKSSRLPQTRMVFPAHERRSAVGRLPHTRTV